MLKCCSSRYKKFTHWITISLIWNGAKLFNKYKQLFRFPIDSEWIYDMCYLFYWTRWFNYSSHWMFNMPFLYPFLIDMLYHLRQLHINYTFKVHIVDLGFWLIIKPWKANYVQRSFFTSFIFFCRINTNIGLEVMYWK